MKTWIMVFTAVLVLSGCSQTSELSEGVSEATEAVMEGEVFSGTLKAAVALGVPMKCEYEVMGAKSVGYVKGEDFAGKMSMDDMVGNVIVKDDCMWSWEEGATEGMKTCFESDIEDMDGVEEEEGSIWDAQEVDDETSYNCTPSLVGDDVFTPPSDVQFMDLMEMMGGMEIPEGFGE